MRGDEIGGYGPPFLARCDCLGQHHKARTNECYPTRAHHATLESGSARIAAGTDERARCAAAETGKSRPYSRMGAGRGVRALDLERCRPSGLANAFVAKAVLGLTTTAGLIERLQMDRALRRICGFPLCKKLPSEATFLRRVRSCILDHRPACESVEPSPALNPGSQPFRLQHSH